MIPAPVEYVRAGSIEEAIERLGGAEGEAAVLAGGQGLVNRLKGRERTPDRLVDIGRIPGLDVVEPTTDGGLRVGCLATHRAIADAPTVAERVPGLADAVAVLGDRQVRNRGTLAGNLVEGARGADPPAVALAQEARLETVGPDGIRTVPARAILGEGSELESTELVRSVEFDGDVDAGGYVRTAHPANGYAMVGVAAAVKIEGGAIDDARVAVTGVTPRPRRLDAVEAALRDVHPDDGWFVEPAATAAGSIPIGEAVGDHHATAEYRTALLPAHVRHALERTAERLDGGYAP